MSTPFLGQIYLVGYNFAQRGFALCEGQTLSIAQYTALFSLLQLYYGGDGRTTFKLPDLQGRVAIGQGSGSGRSPRSMGDDGGSETNTLTSAQLPAHTHPATMHAEDTAPSGSTSPSGALLAQSAIYAVPGRAANVPLSSEAVTVGPNAGGQSVNNMPPFLVLNYEIALQGVFPSRN